MNDNELMLFDRLNVIKDTINKYGQDNFYLSFSGGKDSTILHYLIDMAIPNNTIPRVFINTGIEYNDIVGFVKELSSNDSRFVILAPTKSVKQTLEKYGYPFKSKEHSLRVEQFNNGSTANYIKKYISGYDEKHGKLTLHKCPKCLLYQFEEKGKYNYSNKCCNQMKKKTIHQWEKANNRTIAITGMRNSEGGQRANIKGCILTDKSGNVKRFHPLIKVDDDFENWFIESQNIKLCKLYYPPFNFKRTGCKGCPFSLDLEEQLKTMEIYLPNERKQCEIIWKPVYEEYRRLGYRLKKIEQTKLF